MSEALSVAGLRQLLDEPTEVALLDVREVAEYNLAHIPGFSSLPRRRIEHEIEALVPYKRCLLVVCDDDGRRAALAAATLEGIGYERVAVLAGGLNRWVTEGGETEWGINVPSKAFGERVVREQNVHEVTPDELHAWLQRGEKLVILDSRTPEEHQRATIPGSRSLPGAELGLRAAELIDAPDTKIVVHCAGRTRSIIGARTLQRLGLSNVYALRNGTMGWQLAGFELETGSTRLDLPAPSPDKLAVAMAKARAIASEAGVRFVDVGGARDLMASAGQQTVYCIDVRTREEFEEAHIPGFRWVPGGQLVQATDSYIAVRSGRILLACDGCVRATMTAAWLREMGFAQVYVLDGGVDAWRGEGGELRSGRDERAPAGFAAASAVVPRISPEELRQLLSAGKARVLFCGTSAEFSEAHVPGSHWVPRGWLELRAPDLAATEDTVIVTCPDGTDAVLAAASLRQLGYGGAAALAGGVGAWRAAGFAVESGLSGVTAAPDDVLPARRSFAEMMNYLRWEEALPDKRQA